MSFFAAVTGRWAMNHDNWGGLLVINPSDQIHNEVEDGCVYRVLAIDGTWTGGTGAGLAVTGTVGGKDPHRRTGEQCPASDHRVAFSIAFPGAPPQPFEGYLFTHSPTLMAGYTWWQNQPFAWYASKTR